MSLPNFPMEGPPYNNWLVNSVFGVDAGVFCSQEQLQQAIQLQYSFAGNYQGFFLSSYSSSSTSGGTAAGGVPNNNPQSVVSCFGGTSLAFEFQKQKQEIDRLLHFENQELRTAVQDITRQQKVFLQRYESWILDLIRQKEEDLEIARNRSTELQKLLEKAEVEVKAWHKKAMDNEALVLDLKNRLYDHLTRQTNNVSIHNINGAPDDAESFTDNIDPYSSSSSSSSFLRQGYRRRTQEEQLLLLHKKRNCCKLCNVRRQCVIFLPCRHLCSCRDCESLLALCPVCESVKQVSMEVFLV